MASSVSPRTSDLLIAASRRLSDTVEQMKFASPVAFVYNPLEYARQPHELFLKRYGEGRKRVLFLGMNPGPFGMAQTGIPFGEVAAVRDWLGIQAPVEQPRRVHPKRPIEGFDCRKSEVSGRRLWGFFKTEYGEAARFFADHFVVNYCPLVFMEESGRNRTPEKLPTLERTRLFDACDAHLLATVEALKVEWAVGVGGFAEEFLHRVLQGTSFKITRIPHPSPANPAANKGWDQPVKRILLENSLL
jgi:single-strand selective monofunctional uracil DNA glycosylase